jgi:hypothetical protein
MKPGIPHIVKLLYSSDLEVRQSAANVFSELAAHRNGTLMSFPHMPTIHRCFLPCHDPWNSPYEGVVGRQFYQCQQVRCG